MRSILLCAEMLMIICSPALAQTPSATKPMDLGQILATPIGAMNFKRTTLEKALDETAKRAQIAVVIDWPSLAESKIAGDIPLSLNLPSASVGDALRVILQGASRPNRILDFDVDDGAILISTRAAFARKPVVRVYPCADLLKGQLSPEEQRHLDASVARLWLQHYAVFGPPWRSFSERQVPARIGQHRETSAILDELHASLHARRIGEIVDTIYATIDPASWRAATGAATIRIVGDSLVISQSRPNHRAIAALLDDLRCAQKTGL